jgi:hypothetical protein
VIFIELMLHPSVMCVVGKFHNIICETYHYSSSFVCLFVFDFMKGARRLQQVRSMVGYKNPQTESDEDSWLNIKDEEDPRGRVGVQWPWSRND